MVREAAQRTSAIPEKLVLNKEFTIPGTKKKFKLRTTTKWNWVKPGKVPIHEGYHAAAAPEKVIGMTNVPSAGALGATFFNGEFDPVMAAAPAAFGCEGCSGDHMATILHGHNWEAKQGQARSALHGRQDLVWLIASALEEKSTLSGADVREIKTIWEEGEEVECVIIDENGKEEGVVDIYRVKGIQNKKVPLTKDLLRAVDLPTDAINDNGADIPTLQAPSLV